MSNEQIADHLDAIAALLEGQNGNVFRVRSYRRAAQTIRGCTDSVAGLVRKRDLETLRGLPGIGEKLSRLIVEFAERGHTRLLDRLQGEVTPEKLLRRLPGIGQELARRLVEELDIHTLEDLELAAHDGRLAQMEGFGEKRIAGIKAALAGMLSRSTRPGPPAGPPASIEPDVQTLLDVDREYRERAAAGKLPKIAPRRFNPSGEAWLPILHTERGNWHFTVLYSNTKRAHDLGKTHDWVVLYFEADHYEGQRTVVTETTGGLAGKRIVRGRETDCIRYYAGTPT